LQVLENTHERHIANGEHTRALIILSSRAAPKAVTAVFRGAQRKVFVACLCLKFGLLALGLQGLKSDVALGLYLVRGDTVVLLGELDNAKEAAQGLVDASPEAVRDAAAAQAPTSAGDRKPVEWDFEKLERI
jgi:small ligand-binding sensory domain FIST